MLRVLRRAREIEREGDLDLDRSSVMDWTPVRESIRRPDAKVVAGYQPIMPPHDETQVSEEDVLKVIAFIKALKPGGTPPRVEDSAPPAVSAGATEPGKQKP